ncbi:unnamed protein product [Mytilus edulis]|uniref:DDE-1 domain-containing protein n=1 Tax=Mytilus edulis TaxID=6550 RepID=A0A8S3PSW5_MYTED|nr:unnamed protein product [Mytilus edulis]
MNVILSGKADTCYSFIDPVEENANLLYVKVNLITDKPQLKLKIEDAIRKWGVKFTKQYRGYSPSQLNYAYQLVKDKGIPIRTAARRYEVPEATLRHRLSGYVNPEEVKSGHLVTVLGCGNAQGHSVPPFFVFPGNRMRQELLENKSTGTDGDVSESSWSNIEIFHKYMENHLLKYIPHRTSAVPVLVLFDGHKSHLSMELIEWAKKENIILFVLPAHTSHILQPMDVGCFGPFERIFNHECHKFMRQNCSQPITRYNICGLACKAQVFIQEDASEETCETEAREPVHEIEPIENDIDVPVEEIEININKVEENENA